MIFYHYTAREYLASIAQKGLCKGEVPLSRTETINAVWLTTDNDHAGHGLSDGRALTDKEKDSLRIPRGRMVRFPNKRAIKMKVVVPNDDGNLIRWSKWGKDNLESPWYDNLSRTGGGNSKSRSWYLYFGTIGTDMIAEVYDLTSRCYLNGWPGDFLGEEAFEGRPFDTVS